MNFRGFFQRRIHGAKHLRGQNKRQRREIEPLHEPHAHRRGDVDRPLLERKEVHEPAIQKPNAHMGDKGPAHGRIDTGDKQPQGHDRIHKAFSRHGGALGQPGDRQPQGERLKGRRQRENQRVPKHFQDERVAENFRVILKCVDRLRGADDAGLKTDPDERGDQNEDDQHRQHGKRQQQWRSAQANRKLARHSQYRFHRQPLKNLCSR